MSPDCVCVSVDRRCRRHFGIRPNCSDCRCFYYGDRPHNFEESMCENCCQCDCLTLLHRVRLTVQEMFDVHLPIGRVVFAEHRPQLEIERVAYVPVFDENDREGENVEFLKVVPVRNLTLMAENGAIGLSLDVQTGAVMLPGLARHQARSRNSKWLDWYVAPLVRSTDRWLNLKREELLVNNPCTCIGGDEGGTQVPWTRCKRLICSLLVLACAENCDDMLNRHRHFFYGDVKPSRLPVGVRRGHVRNFCAYDDEFNEGLAGDIGTFYSLMSWYEDVDDHFLGLYFIMV